MDATSTYSPDAGGDGSSNGSNSNTAANAVGKLAGQARDALQSGTQDALAAAEDTKAEVSGKMDGFAEAIHAAAREMEKQMPQGATYVHDAAESVKQLSAKMSNSNVEELLGELNQLARKHPAALLAASVAAGFALSRFLKSSTHTGTASS